MGSDRLERKGGGRLWSNVDVLRERGHMTCKIAVVHDWLVTLGGAERVLADILRLWPNAELFAVIDYLSDSDRSWLCGRHAVTTRVQRFPFAKSKYRSYLPFMPSAIEQLDVSGFDIVISSSHAVAKGVLVGPDQLHICYCHTPMRYAWDMQSQYLHETGLDKGLRGVLARAMLFRMRNWDHRSSNGVDFFVSNSDYTGRRIQKVYRRDSTTIYPGVAVEDLRVCTEKEDFYLTASRLVPYKRVRTVVQAFSLMPEKKLIVIGDGPEYKRVAASASSNVKVLGYQTRSVLVDYLQRARAFVFAAEEDFGILPVEAQSCGTPVIAFGRGGARETVVSNETGVFFSEQTPDAIKEAVERFEAGFVPDAMRIRRHAERFSCDAFRTRFKAFVDEKYGRSTSKPGS